MIEVFGQSGSVDLSEEIRVQKIVRLVVGVVLNKSVSYVK